MFGSKFKAESCEIQCRLCLGRIRLMRNKRTVQLQGSRKEIANLLKTGKQEYARIRVEGVIREQLMLQAYEILELYVELLAVRAQLVAKTKEIPRDMVEAISSMIYSAQRIGDMPELVKLRGMFESKYGKQYVQEANNDATSSKWQVNQNLIRCLLVEPPQAEEKLSMLSEIAQENGVEWDLSAAARDLLPPAAIGPGPGQMPPPGPGLNPHFGGGVGAPGPPHLYPHAAAAGQYESASQAAAAAAYAATQAKAAADYAAQFAMHQAGLPPPSDQQGWHAQQGMPQGLAAAAGPQAPGPQAPGQFPGMAGFDAGGVAPPAAGWQPPSSNGSSSGGAAVGAAGSSQADTPSPYYVGRTNEDIQRAYDQAQGPPTKPASAPLPPPASAPPPWSGPASNAVPPMPPSHMSMPGAPSGLGLPAPPSAGVQPGAPGTPEDEYEALTRRLEALKRS